MTEVVVLIVAVSLLAAVGLAVWVVNDRATADRLDGLADAGLLRRLDDVPVVTGHVINADMPARDQIEDANTNPTQKVSTPS